MPILHSEHLDQLATALCELQKNPLFAAFNKKIDAPNLKSRYANLEALWEAVREPATALGFSLTQAPGPAVEICQRPFASLSTMLLHKSGQWIAHEGQAEIQLINKAVNWLQCYGITITYMRRYGLAAVLGITTGEDDGDGQSAFAKAHSERRDRITDDEIPLSGTGTAPGETWLSLFHSRDWEEVPSPEGGEMLGMMGFDAMGGMIQRNAQAGGINPALTAANAHYVLKAAKKKGFDDVDSALEAAKWTGPKFEEMDAHQVMLAGNVIQRNLKSK